VVVEIWRKSLIGGDDFVGNVEFDLFILILMQIGKQAYFKHPHGSYLIDPHTHQFIFTLSNENNNRVRQEHISDKVQRTEEHETKRANESKDV